MKKVNLLQNIKNIHFIGIGGVSMSALAELLKHKGYNISGSDARGNEQLVRLNRQGIITYIGHSESNIKDAQLVVYTAAIAKDNIELLQAKRQNIPCIDRAQLLAEIAKGYDNVIAVAGMHGKTTTTAMLAQVFVECGKNPTIHIGGDFDKIGGNICLGSEEFFITEACEYKDSFLALAPTVAVVTNIEKEHLDYFKNFAHIKRSFNKFCKSATRQVFVNYDYSKFVDQKTITYGERGEYVATNLEQKQGKFSFDVYNKGVKLSSVQLAVVGKHNVYNALATVAVAGEYGLPQDKVAKALSEFGGVSRRFEHMGEFKGADIIRDYAHHPTEIKCSIKTAIDTYNRPVVVLFQPHTYSRTKTLFKDFLECFSGAERVVLVDTYSAREKFDQKGSCEALARGLRKAKPSLRVFGSFDKNKALGFLKGSNLQGKVLLVLGAGDIVDLINEIKN